MTQQSVAGRESSEPIVVGIDGSGPARTALFWAAAEARRWGRNLLVVHTYQYPTVAAGFGVAPDLADPGIVHEAAVQLARDEIASVLGPHTGLRVDLEVVCGSPAAVLVELSKEAEVLVVGSRGRGGFTGLLLGSVSQQAAQHSRCPVVIIREPEA